MTVQLLRVKVRRVKKLLEDKYPLSSIPESFDHILDRLVFHHLSMHVPVTHAASAYRALREEFADWNEVRVSTVMDISEVLAKGNVQDPQLAYSLRSVLSQAFEEPNFTFLTWLRNGQEGRKVPPKSRFEDPSVAEYLLLSGGKEEIAPLDAHTERILLRVGVFGKKSVPAKRRLMLQKIIPLKDPRETIEYHHLFVEHGKKTCTESEPHCDRCVLAKDCDFFKDAKVKNP